MTNDDKNRDGHRSLDPHGQRRRRGQRLTPSSHSPALVRATRDLWEPRYGRRLSDEEARQILENMIGFSRVLLAWSGAESQDVDRAA